MVCCMDSLNVLFLACKRFKTQLHVLNSGEAARSGLYVPCLDGVALVAS